SGPARSRAARTAGTRPGSRRRPRRAPRGTGGPSSRARPSPSTARASGRPGRPPSPAPRRSPPAPPAARARSRRSAPGPRYGSGPCRRDLVGADPHARPFLPEQLDEHAAGVLRMDEGVPPGRAVGDALLVVERRDAVPLARRQRRVPVGHLEGDVVGPGAAALQEPVDERVLPAPGDHLPAD